LVFLGNYTIYGPLSPTITGPELSTIPP